MNTSEPLSEAPVKTLFFKYYIPALTSILSITVHQLVNGIILGQQVGKEGLAAVGLYGPVVILLVALTLPLMIGGGILTGKNIGAKNYLAAQTIFQFSTTLAILFGGAIALSSPLLIKPLANFLAGAQNTILVNNTADYLLWQLIGSPFFFLGMFWGNFISNDGTPKISRNASLIAVSLNILLDLLLIVGLDLGVEGASIATAISIFASTSYLFFYIQAGKSHFSLRHYKFTLKLKEWKELLNLGLPSFASEICFSFGLLILNQCIVPYGPLAISTFGLVNFISFIFLRLFTAAMVASMRIIAFNIGAKLPGRVLDVFKFSLAFTMLLGLVITAIGFFFADLLILLFAGDETLHFKQLASKATTLYFLLFIAAGPNFILSAYFQSIGKAVLSILINILKGLVFIIFFLLLLQGYLKVGVSSIWLSRSLAEILTLLLLGAYTFYNKENYYTEKVILNRS